MNLFPLVASIPPFLARTGRSAAASATGALACPAVSGGSEMKRLLRAVVSALRTRGLAAPYARLDWRGRPCAEDGPLALALSGGAAIPSVTSIDDSLVPPAYLKPPARAQD